jgi:hypothetical protein
VGDGRAVAVDAGDVICAGIAVGVACTAGRQARQHPIMMNGMRTVLLVMVAVLWPFSPTEAHGHGEQSETVNNQQIDLDKPLIQQPWC